MKLAPEVEKALKALNNYIMSSQDADFFEQTLAGIQNIEEIYKQRSWKAISEFMDIVYGMHKVCSVMGKAELSKFYYEVTQALIQWSADNLTLKDLKEFTKYLESTK